MATGSSGSDVIETTAPQDTTYPEQRHAGKVGYGPNYNMSASIIDKMSGLIEESRGRITNNPDLIRAGHEKYTGAAKRRKALGLDSNEPNAFGTPSPSSEPLVGTPKTDESQMEQPPVHNMPGTESTTDPGDMTGTDAHMNDVGAKEQAATVAPQGTQDCNMQRKGEAVNRVRLVDERM